MGPPVLLRAALLVLVGSYVSGAETASGSCADATDGSPGVCLLQHAEPVFGRRSGRHAALAEPRAEDLLAGEDGEESEAPLGGRPEHAARTAAVAPHGHHAVTPGSHARHSTPGHGDAAEAAEGSEPGQFLDIRSWPDAGAPLTGLLQAGEQFRVKGQKKTSSGEVWLELSDGRGFVRRSQAARVDEDTPAAVGLLDASRADDEDAPEVSQDPMANGFPRKVAPKHDVDHDAMHMKKTKMSVKGLPEESTYVNHKTQSADWREEYPWSTEAPSPALAQSGASRAAPLAAALAAALAWVSL